MWIVKALWHWRLFCAYGPSWKPRTFNAFNGTSLAALGEDLPFTRAPDGAALMTREDAERAIELARAHPSSSAGVHLFVHPYVGGLVVPAARFN